MTMGRWSLCLAVMLSLALFVVGRVTAEEFQTQSFHVTGVSQSDPDGLILRAAPGPAARKIGSFAFDADGILAGNCKMVGRAQWCHVKRGGSLGWVNMRFLALTWGDGGQPPRTAVQPSERPTDAKPHPRDAMCSEYLVICQDYVQEAINVCFSGNRGQDFINCKEETGINRQQNRCMENWKNYCNYDSDECPTSYNDRYRPACSAR